MKKMIRMSALLAACALLSACAHEPPTAPCACDGQPINTQWS